MSAYHVTSAEYMKQLGMSRSEVVDIMNSIEEMYTKIKSGMWSVAVDNLMTSKDLSTLADVREYLKFDLNKTFITKSTFNALNTSDLPFTKDDREIIALCENNKMFNRFVTVTHTRTSGEWAKTYFRYCCLEFEGRKIMSQLSQGLLATLEMDDIYLDRELSKWFCEGNELDDLTGLTAKDRVLIAGEFLRSTQSEQLTYTYGTALQTLATLSDHYCQAWYYLTSKLDDRDQEMLYLTKNLSYTAIGTMYNLSGSRVRDIIEGIKRKFNNAKIVAAIEGKSGYSLPSTKSCTTETEKAKRILAGSTRPWVIFKRALEGSKVPQTFTYLGFTRNRVDLFNDMSDYMQPDRVYEDCLYITSEELDRILNNVVLNKGV